MKKVTGIVLMGIAAIVFLLLFLGSLYHPAFYLSIGEFLESFFNRFILTPLFFLQVILLTLFAAFVYWCINRKYNWNKHVSYWIDKHLLLLSIITPFVLIVFRILFSDIQKTLKEVIGLEFYQLIVLMGAIFTLLWNSKRYRQAEKRYRQGEESIFLNKINNTYLDLVKAISHTEEKDTVTPRNLINSIQASIDTHYEDENKKVEMRARILNFSNMFLSEVNLIGADLSKANLTGADLTGADLRNANLTGADLNGAKLTGAYLNGADLRNADLSNADLSDANLNNANLRDAYLTGADLRNANLSDAHLSDAHLNNAKLNNAKLRNADLTGADLSEADLTGADLSKAVLTGAKCQKARGIPADIIKRFDLTI